ncbi:MAG: class I SAM-dependent RNA methyltransferase [Leptospira sp.]|nr:class I SAM-dependent RNA methyltransferase [Leptospira sp.]
METTDKPPIIAEITKLGEDLSGKTIVNGKVHSFRYTKPGDIVTFRFFGRGKRRWEKIESITINTDHSSVACPYFASCGGCSGQHIPYAEQFALQTDRLVRNYKEIWDIDVKTVPAADSYHYRNRMDFSIFPHGFGLREAGNFRKIVDIEKCLIQSDWANQEWKIIRGYIQENPDLPLDRKSEQGTLKYVTLRKAVNTDDSMSIFTFDKGKRESSDEKELEAWLLLNSTAKHIIFCYNPRPSEVSAAGEYRIVRGNSSYEELIRSNRFLVPFDSFFQPNPKQFEPILEAIENWLDDSGAKNFLDLFCGSGFFSILFGEKVETIMGWDSFKPSVETAMKLVSEKYPSKNVLFEQVDLFQRKQLPKFLEGFQKTGIKTEDSFLVLDPPRNGAGSMVLEWIMESGIQRIAYVSCNPRKQWDEIMNELGKEYQPIDALITDPYPHTPHLESVVLLEKKKKPLHF